MKKRRFSSLSLTTSMLIASLALGPVLLSPPVNTYAADSMEQQSSQILSHAERMVLLAQKKQAADSAKLILDETIQTAQIAFKENMTAANTELSVAQTARNEAQANMDASESAVNDLQNSIESTKSEIETLNQLLTQLKKIDTSLAAIDKAKKEADAAQSSYESAKGNLSQAQTAYDIAKDAYENLVSDYNDKNEELLSLNTIKNNADTALINAENDKKEADAAVLAAQKNYNESGHYETVITTPAWDETAKRGYHMCLNCGAKFYSDQLYDNLDYNDAIARHITNKTNILNGCSHYTTKIESYNIHHDAESEDIFVYNETLKDAINDAQIIQKMAESALLTAQTTITTAKNNLNDAEETFHVLTQNLEIAESEKSATEINLNNKKVALQAAKNIAEEKESFYDMLVNYDTRFHDLTSSLDEQSSLLAKQTSELETATATLVEAQRISTEKQNCYSIALNKQKRAVAVTYESAMIAVITDNDFSFLNAYIVDVKQATHDYDTAVIEYENTVFLYGNDIDYKDHIIVNDAAVSPGCTSTGLTAGSHCAGCGEVIVVQKIVPAIGHTAETLLQEASTDTDGSIITQCKACNEIFSKEIIPAAKTISLSYKTVRYDGKSKCPAVTIKDTNGNLIDSSNYIVTFQNNTKIGTATAIIVFKNKYTGTVKQYYQITKAANSIFSSNINNSYSSRTQYFYIKASNAYGAKQYYASNNKNIQINSYGKISVAKNYVGSAVITIRTTASSLADAASRNITVTVNPSKTTLSSVKDQKNGNGTASWSRNSKVSGYQVQYSLCSDFSSNTRTINLSNNKKTSTTLTDLADSSRYYVRVRTYKTVNGKKYYSSWSNIKSMLTSFTPDKTTISSVKNYSGKKMKIKWKRKSDISGYMIQYAAINDFRDAHTEYVRSFKTTSRTVIVAEKNKKYYIRIRTYKVFNSKIYYSAWSKLKTITVKK